MSPLLPDVPVPDQVSFGRNAREGYQRGWGLEFGKLRDRIAPDPILQRAMTLARGRTIVAPMRLMNLYLLIRYFLDKLPSQNIIEFGSYKGGSALFMASCLRDLFPTARVYALDTFEGMPETGDVDWVKPGDFKDTDVKSIVDAARQAGLSNLVVVQGRFEHSFPGISGRIGSIGLAHIDCDIYSAVKYSQDAVWEKMCAGGYLVYDDATTSSCLGATQAVEDLVIERRLHSEQIWPHFVFRAKLDS